MTIEPPWPDFRIKGMPCFAVRKTPSMFTAVCFRQSASDISGSGP